MTAYFDVKSPFDKLAETAAACVVEKFAGYRPDRTRRGLLANGFDPSKVRRMLTSPMDYQWAYVERDHKLWNRSSRHCFDTCLVKLKFSYCGTVLRV